jgi:hypothetical protein
MFHVCGTVTRRHRPYSRRRHAVDGTWLEDGTYVRFRYPSTAPGSTDVLPELLVSYLAKMSM